MLLLFVVVLFSPLRIYAVPAFTCNFEDGTMCEMQNGVWFDPELPLYNFSTVTGESAPDRELAPSTDHTLNSSSGHFLYWHHPTHTIHTRIDGRVSTPIFEQREHMCLNFAYYINSSDEIRKNGTYLTASVKGCYRTSLWVVNTDSTQGWTTAEVQLLDYTCNITIWFDVSGDIVNAVVVALDDISVDICSRYLTTTTGVPVGHSARLSANICLLITLFLILLAIM